MANVTVRGVPINALNTHAATNKFQNILQVIMYCTYTFTVHILIYPNKYAFHKNR